jgi:hypothetical protein
MAFVSASGTDEIAHRGYLGNGAPENTHASIRQAIQVGFAGIEFDARLTSDGRAVLMHDATLDRTSNNCTGLVSSYTLDEIMDCDLSANGFTARVASVSETMAYIHTLSQQYGWDGTVLVHIKVTFSASKCSGIINSVSKIYNEERRVVFLTEDDANATRFRAAGWDGSDEGKSNLPRTGGNLSQSTDVERIGQMVHTAADWSSVLNASSVFDMAVPYDSGSIGYDAALTPARVAGLSTYSKQLVGLPGFPDAAQDYIDAGASALML